MTEAHRLSLLPQIGELATGHFVKIDFRGPGARPGIERQIPGADSLPIIGALIESGERRPVSRGVCARAATIELRFG